MEWNGLLRYFIMFGWIGEWNEMFKNVVCYVQL